MSIGSIIRVKQPDVYRKLVKFTNNKKVQKSDKNICFEDFEKMMRHDGHKRIGGAIRQVKHG